MDEIEVIDRMLRYDVEHNSGEYRGFVQASSLFDELEIPNNIRSYVLDGVMYLGLFEHNTPRTRIRATYLGRKVYYDGGYKKYKRNEKIADWLGYMERAINTLKP